MHVLTLFVTHTNNAFRGIFGVQSTRTNNEEDQAEDNKPNCGLVCNLFPDLKDIQGQIEEAKRRQQDKENEIDPVLNEEDDGFDVNNSTYTEEV